MSKANLPLATKDGYPIEAEYCDAGHAPLPPGEVWRGLNLNMGALWIRLPGDDWYRCGRRSYVTLKHQVAELELLEVKALISSNML